MDIKKVLFSACCILSVCMVVISGVISISEKQREKERNISAINDQQIQIEKKEKNNEGTGYMIKANGDTVAVFDLIDMQNPIQTTDIYLDTLRNYDRKLLEEGITVYGEEGLCLILEDFGS